MLPVAGLRARNMQMSQPLPLTPPLPSLIPDLRPQRTVVQAVGVGQVFKYMLLGSGVRGSQWLSRCCTQVASLIRKTVWSKESEHGINDN